MGQLRLGVIGATRKENERRLPIHPHHFDRTDADRASIYLERGYGEYFGVSDTQLSGWVAGMRSREQLIAECDVILLLKPHARDLAELRSGQVVWGLAALRARRGAHSAHHRLSTDAYRVRVDEPVESQRLVQIACLP